MRNKGPQYSLFNVEELKNSGFWRLRVLVLLRKCFWFCCFRPFVLLRKRFGFVVSALLFCCESVFVLLQKGKRFAVKGS